MLLQVDSQWVLCFNSYLAYCLQISQNFIDSFVPGVRNNRDDWAQEKLVANFTSFGMLKHYPQNLRHFHSIPKIGENMQWKPVRSILFVHLNEMSGSINEVYLNRGTNCKWIRKLWLWIMGKSDKGKSRGLLLVQLMILELVVCSWKVLQLCCHTLNQTNWTNIKENTKGGHSSSVWKKLH